MNTAPTFANVLESNNYLLLDTETTGIGESDEIVNIAIIDAYTHIYLDTLVKPTIPIPDEATAVHGITNEMVENAPSWNDVAPFVNALMRRRNVVIYNADFDLRLMMQSSFAVERTPAFYDRNETPAIWCAMLQYAAIRKIVGRYGWKWHKLQDALIYEGQTDLTQNHQALGDCLLTLDLCRIMHRKLNGEKETV